jgi:hypothetical protein
VTRKAGSSLCPACRAGRPPRPRPGASAAGTVARGAAVLMEALKGYLAIPGSMNSQVR